MRRLLVCVPGVPHRSRGASSVLFFHYLDQLLRAGYQVLCLLLVEKSSDAGAPAAELRAELQASGSCEVHAAVVPELLRFDKYSGRPIPAALAGDAVELARRFDAPQVLYFDLGCLAAGRALGEGRRRAVWLGDLTYASHWNHGLYDARESPLGFLKLPKLWLICRRWQAAYREFLAGVDLIVVSSKSSEAGLAALGVPRAAYLPYPWPVEKTFQPVALKRKAGDRPRFLFCGTLSGLGSRSALHYLLDELYPELLRQWGADGFEILITGARTLPAWALASIAQKAETAFEGFVDDLYARMDRCHAAIVPIDVPVGNRSRIVTAMGYGLLVIAHPNTALGNPALLSGETCLLAETPSQFAGHMRSAHEDAALAERIERKAREVYEQQFEPRAAARLLMERLEALA